MREEMQLSVKLLKSKRYQVLPFYSKPDSRGNKQLRAIRLIHAKSGRDAWPYGRISLDQLSPLARQYVTEEFTDLKHLKVFSDLGD